MKFHTKHALKMMEVMTLLLVMLVGMTACGGNIDDNSAPSSTESENLGVTESDGTENSQTADEILPVSSIEEAEAWHLYSDGS